MTTRCQTFFMEYAYRILKTLGPMPGGAPAAMVDYGLSDSEIGRYFDLPHDTLMILRLQWKITGDP